MTSSHATPDKFRVLMLDGQRIVGWTEPTYLDQARQDLRDIQVKFSGSMLEADWQTVGWQTIGEDAITRIATQKAYAAAATLTALDDLPIVEWHVQSTFGGVYLYAQKTAEIVEAFAKHFKADVETTAGAGARASVEFVYDGVPVKVLAYLKTEVAAA